MVKKTFYVNLDIKQPSTNPDIVVVEGDNGNEIVVTLADGGVAVDLTDCRILAAFALSDKRTVQQDNDGHGITTDADYPNIMTIDLYTSSFAPGTVNCEIVVFSGVNHDVLVTSAQFNFECRRSIMNADTIQATDEYPMLVDLIQRTEAVEDRLIPIDANEDARQANEATRVSQESTRVTAESGRASAESGRVTAESGRVSAEQARVTAESGRASAESGRTSAESGRTSAESTRVTNETNRGNAETARASAESTRQSSETARGSAETARASAESGRVSAESGRVTAEGSRATAESARISAETTRGNAETSRASAESGRSSSESARVSAESSRASAESGRASAESARSSAETARASAETARAGRDTAFQAWADYSAVTAYVPLNKVQHGGSSYICIANTTGNAPPNATYWQLIAAKGVDGEGAGDMLASVYDPGGKASDAFSMGNMVETSTKKIMTDTERTKLAGVADNANNYTHPTTAGNKHIPTGGASGQFLKYSASGTAVWNTPVAADVGAAASSHTHGNITNAGAIGSTADLPVFTGAGGALGTKTATQALTALGAVPASAYADDLFINIRSGRRI